MAIERLPEKKLWHEIYRGASAYNAVSGISAGNPIVCWKNVKHSKLQGIVLTGAAQMMFNVVVRDQDHTNPFVRKRYRLQNAGTIIDYRPWPLSLVRWGANKEICVFMALSGASASLFTADMEILTLMG